MTEQEIFNTVCDHLMKQGRKSKGSWQYAYRGEGGAMCAVGCLISDDEYDEGMEGDVVEQIYGRGDLPPRLEPHVNFLAELQVIHDHEAVREWPTHLRKLAAERNLTVPASVPA